MASITMTLRDFEDSSLILSLFKWNFLPTVVQQSTRFQLT